MPEPEATDPSETFTFVDKRRVAEDDPAPEEAAHDPVESFPEEDAVDENLEADDQPTSIYDIAAYCTGLLITEGFQRMGLLADPKTGKAAMDLPSARVAIDCVAALVNVLDETSSTLPDSVRREMRRTLNDLRLNYVDRVRS